jgi:hypothetical protein
MENNAGLDQIFGADAQVAENVVDEATSNSNSARSEKVKQMREGFKAALVADPTLADRCRIWSDSIEVINTLGYGKNGNIKVDKKASTKENRVLEPTSKIVGYTVKNNGQVAIPYQTEEFALDQASGKYVGTVVQKSWAPGETIQLTRRYMAALCSIPEIGMSLSNGKIVMPSGKTNSPVQTLSACYFTFSKEDGRSINDDTVKLSIDVDGVVKDEYVAAFGDFNNPKEPKKREGSKDPRFTTQDYAANYIQQLLKEGGLN